MKIFLWRFRCMPPLVSTILHWRSVCYYLYKRYNQNSSTEWNATLCYNMNHISFKLYRAATWTEWTQNDLHREIRMVVIVVENIANGLVEHRKQSAECSQSGEVHDVLKSLSVVKTFRNQCITCKVRLKYNGTLALYLSHHKQHNQKL